MKNIYRILFILLFVSCQNEPLYYEGDFATIYELALKKEKKLWMMVGGGANCHACNDIIDKLEAKKIFRKYKDDYLFYKCNGILPSNRFLQYILLMEETPNSYIFDEKGELVFTSFQHETPESIEEGIIHVNRGNRYHCMQEQFYIDNQEDLFKMHNYTLQAYLGYIKGRNTINLIDSSINIYPYFYNLYLKGKILEQNENKNEADTIYKTARQYYKDGYQAIVYKELFDSISNGIAKTDDKPKIKFENEIIDCGVFKLKSHNTIDVSFKNEGNQPLVVFYVQSSCGCTKINFSKKPIMPNEKSIINITYDAKDLGVFSRELYVQSNASNNVVKLVLSGSVKKT